MAFNPNLLVKLGPYGTISQLNDISAPGAEFLTPQLWLYNSGDDTGATVLAAGYFNFAGSLLGTLFYNSGSQFRVGDVVYCKCSDGNIWLNVVTAGPSATTVAQGSGPDSVGTADIQDLAVTAAKLAADAVTNVKVAAAAAIAFSKLAALPSAQILVGSAGNVATATAVTGDIAITNGGVTSIAAGAVVNADINAAAAIDFSKLAALASARLLVGSAGNVATAVDVTGDVTISNAGVTAIGAAKVTKAMLAATVRPSHMIVFAGSLTTVGGAAAEAFAVVGAVGATDKAYVQITDDGTGNVTALQAVVTNDTLTVTFSANPGNDCTFNYQIIRATS